MKKLLLVDGHSLIHRAYHAYPKTLATAKGELTNAVYGFTNILLTAVSELVPTHAAVAFDLPKPTFREQMFVGYKQSRLKPDDDMIIQIPRIKEIVAALNIPIYEVAGYEADDVIGTLAKQAISEKSAKSAKISSNQIADKPDKSESGLSDLSIIRSLADDNRHSDFSVKVIILTSDRDLMQLIRGDKVAVKLPPRGSRAKAVSGIQHSTFNIQNSELWNEDRFISVWGFAPCLLPDYKALAGDASDDIPGVKGIGEKTAKLLVSSFGAVDDVYISLGISPTQVQSSKFKVQSYSSKLKITETIIKKLADGQEDAQLSKKLATIDTAVPIKLDWKQTEIHQYDKDKILKLFDELQFKSLAKKLPNDKFEQTVQDALF